jgi:hypothetical protein
MRDPFILEAEPGGFVLFGTTDENIWGGPATGFDCYTSTDLEEWAGPIPAFRPADDFWSHSQYWAPEVNEYRGRYYMFATFAPDEGEANGRGVAVLVADSATGPYAPWSDGTVTPIGMASLDGTLFFDDDEPWLVYSRGAEGVGDAEGITDGEMYALQLADDLRTSTGEPRLLFHASDAAWSKPLQFPPGVEPPPQLKLAKDPLFTDGPCLVRTSDGTLLMLWSSFGDEGYAIGVASSASGSVLGPWLQREHPLWARNGGHGMVLHTTAGADFLVFHWPNDTPDERVKLVEVDITADGIQLRSAASAP